MNTGQQLADNVNSQEENEKVKLCLQVYELRFTYPNLPLLIDCKLRKAGSISLVFTILSKHLAQCLLLIGNQYMFAE